MIVESYINDDVMWSLIMMMMKPTGAV